MTLDPYATLAMSDKPERVFSMVDNLLSPRRKHLKKDGIEQMLFLKSGRASGNVKLDQQSFNRAVVRLTECIIDEDLIKTNLVSNNLLYHEHSQL